MNSGFSFLTQTALFLYIDPGTGSMLFSIFIALVATLTFAFRALLMKAKFVLAGGKKAKVDANNLGLVIFSDDKRYWNVFGPICREAEARGVKLHYFTQSADDPCFGESFNNVVCEFIGEGNKGFAKMNMLNADIVLSSTPHLGVYQWKRSRNVGRYVHILHATDDMMNYKMFSMDSYDAVLLTGSFQVPIIRKLEALRHTKAKDLLVTGYAPMDDQLKKLSPKHLSLKLPLFSKKASDITILVAPSWGKEALLSKYGERLLSACVATGYNVVVRPHPQTKKSEGELLQRLVAQFPESEKFHWNSDVDNFECLNSADILITDFSGIVYDWAFVFDKPFIYAGADFDPSIYEAQWLLEAGEKLWRREALAKMGVELDEAQFDNMKAVIDKALSSDKLKEARHTLANEAWQCRGEGAKRVVDYLIEAQKKLIDNSAKSEGASGEEKVMSGKGKSASSDEKVASDGEKVTSGKKKGLDGNKKSESAQGNL